MSLKRRIRVDDLHQKRLERRALEFAFITDDEGEVDSPIGSLRMQHQYSVSLKCVARFWANSIELENMQEMAKEQLFRCVYEDIESRLPELQYLIYNESKEEALTIVKELINLVKWKEV